MDSSRYDDNAGLGLGLGLPSVFGFNNGSLRAPTDKTVKMGSVPIDSASPEYLFPIPAQRSRSASSSSIRVRNLVSYWSPVSDEGEMESFDDEDELEHFHEDEGEDPRGDHQGQEQCCNIALPSGLHVHQCLHMLSPKGDTLARAAAANGLTAEEAISSALEWAWLVPMLDPATADKRITHPVSPQAPAMSVAPSLASLASDLSLRSGASYESDLTFTSSLSPASLISERHRSPLSRRSQSTLCSPSSSLGDLKSSPSSVLNRKRPVSYGSRCPEANVIKLKGTRTRLVSNDHLKSVKPALTHKSSITSVHSYTGSIGSFSFTSAEEEAIMQPMERLPSPLLERQHTSAHQEMVKEPATCRADTKTDLYDLWAAAEDAERERRVLKKAPRRQERRRTQTKMPEEPSHCAATAPSGRVSKWVHRIRKSTSTALLRDVAPEDEGLDITEMLQLEETYLEPRQRRSSPDQAPQASIEERLLSSEQPEMPAAGHKPARMDPVWQFLG